MQEQKSTNMDENKNILIFFFVNHRRYENKIWFQNICQTHSTHVIFFFQLMRLFAYSWTLGAVTCKLIYMVQTLSAFCSVLTLVAISLDRWETWVDRIRTTHTTRAPILGSLILCFFFHVWCLKIFTRSDTLKIYFKYFFSFHE